MKNNKDRFEVTYKGGNEFSTAEVILVDKVTGVNYLFVKSGYGAGLTPLLDREGKPIVSSVGTYDLEK